MTITRCSSTQRLLKTSEIAPITPLIVKGRTIGTNESRETRHLYVVSHSLHISVALSRGHYSTRSLAHAVIRLLAHLLTRFPHDLGICFSQIFFMAFFCCSMRCRIRHAQAQASGERRVARRVEQKMISKHLEKAKWKRERRQNQSGWIDA